MNYWKTSRTLLERMAEREQKIARIRNIEEQWYATEDFSSQETYRLMVEWTKQQIIATGMKGLVVGVSGGVDSTLGALIAKDAMPQNTIALMIPAGSGGEDSSDASQIIDTLGFEKKIIDIEPIIDSFTKAINLIPSPGVRGNIISRIRNAVMYAEANARSYLVLGTGDLDEAYIGYSTKGTTSDLFVTNGLHKWEVKEHVKRELGKYNNSLAERIITKPSTPGYKKGHNAEDEIGIRYERIAEVLDLIMDNCDIFSTGILPKNTRDFEEIIAKGGLSPDEILHVEKLMMANYHKGFGSPSLWRSR